jgi:hypothetical protein
MRTIFAPDIMDIIESHLRPHCLSSLRDRAQLNQERMMVQLRRCLKDGTVYWKNDSAGMFAYACIRINNKL